MFLGHDPAGDTSIAVSGSSSGLMGDYVWTLREKMGLVRVEYDTEGVASALLDQSKHDSAAGLAWVVSRS